MVDVIETLKIIDKVGYFSETMFVRQRVVLNLAQIQKIYIK